MYVRAFVHSDAKTISYELTRACKSVYFLVSTCIRTAFDFNTTYRVSNTLYKVTIFIYKFL